MSDSLRCPHCSAPLPPARPNAAPATLCMECGGPLTPDATSLPVIEAEFVARGRKKSSTKVIWIVLACLISAICICAGLLYVVLSYSFESVTKAVRTNQCQSGLLDIQSAVTYYETDSGEILPAVSTNRFGQKVSWRVLLLPYLGHSDLYDRYDQTEPWDGPNNRRLSSEIANVYRCPAATDSETDTNYVFLVSGGRPLSSSADVDEGPRRDVAMVVEVVGSGIHWMEPRDLDFDTMSFTVNDPDRPCVCSEHPQSANVLFGDGRVEKLRDDLPPESVREMLYPTIPSQLEEFDGE